MSHGVGGVFLRIHSKEGPKSREIFLQTIAIISAPVPQSAYNNTDLTPNSFLARLPKIFSLSNCQFSTRISEAFEKEDHPPTKAPILLDMHFPQSLLGWFSRSSRTMLHCIACRSLYFNIVTPNSHPYVSSCISTTIACFLLLETDELN